MNTPKSLLGDLVSRIAAEKSNLFARIDKSGLTAISAAIILTSVAGACLYNDAQLLKASPSVVNVAATTEAPTNVAEAAADVDNRLGAVLEVSETNNAILRYGLQEIASIDLSSVKNPNRTFREMAGATLGDISDVQDIETKSGASPEKIKHLVQSGQMTARYKFMLETIAESKYASPEILQKVAVSALKNAGDEVPTLAHLDLLGAIEKAIDLKAVALHEIRDELKTVKGDQAELSERLKDSALSGLNGNSSAERIAVMALAKAEMAAGGQHGAEVTAAYNKSVTLDNFLTEVVGKYVDGDIEPATFAELAEKTQAQMTAFESAEAPSPHKM